MSAENPAGPLGPAERDRLVEENLGLARRLSRRFVTAQDPSDDLFQVASLGLLLAAERFDPTKGRSFVAFAIPTVLGELRRHIRDTHWSLRVPRRVQENVEAIRRVRQDLVQELGRSPRAVDVADAIGLPVEDVLEAMEATSFLRATPGDPEHDTATSSQNEDRTVRRVATERAAAQLTERERRILVMRFGQDMTQTEIGDEIGLSQAHVHRLLKGAEKRLRELLEER